MFISSTAHLPHISHPEEMTFDPLELFSAPQKRLTPEFEQRQGTLRQQNYDNVSLSLNSMGVQRITRDISESLENQENEHNHDPSLNSNDIPLHIHDLPLLQLKPPSLVLLLFLYLFAPDQVLNFSPQQPETDPETIFNLKNALPYINDALPWLLKYCPRFTTRNLLAAVSSLAESLRKGSMSEYNAWLTQLIASELPWIEPEPRESIKNVAALRLAENCGRTAHPEILRAIEIPHLPKQLQLKEPSLTADNLGLKTWGSSFLLGSRLARPDTTTQLLKSPVLELGAGTGLVGMVSCLLGYETMLTDLAEIVPNLRQNLNLNEINNGAVDELDWLNPTSFVQKYSWPKYNTIILSDPLYSSKHPQWIVDMINLFLAEEPSAAVLLQVPVRRNFEEERATLWRLMGENGYVMEFEDTESGHDDFGQSDFLFKKYLRSEKVKTTSA